MMRVRELDWMTPQGIKLFPLNVSSSEESSLGPKVSEWGPEGESGGMPKSPSVEDSLDKQPNSNSIRLCSDWSSPVESSGSSEVKSDGKMAAMFPSSGRKHMNVDDYKKWSLEKIKAIEIQMAAIPNKRDPVYKKLSKQRQA